MKFPSLRHDSFFAFQQIIDFCLVKQVPLIIAGDVFDDRRPDSETVCFAVEQMRRMRRDGLYCYYLRGQHDEVGRPWLDLGHWPEHMHRKHWAIEGVRFYGLDWTPRDRLAEELAKIPPNTDVLVCHQVWEELMGKIRQCEGALKDVPHVSNIITGDYHRHDKFLVKRDNGTDVLVISPGSTNMRTIDEDPCKYFWGLCKDGRWTSIPIKSREYMLHTVRSEEEFQAALLQIDRCSLGDDETLPEELRKPMCIIRYHESLVDVEKRASQLINDRFHLFLECVRAKRQETEQLHDDALVEGGLEMAIEKKHPSTTLVGSTAQRLLRAGRKSPLLLRQEMDKIAQEVEEGDKHWSELERSDDAAEQGPSS